MKVALHIYNKLVIIIIPIVLFFHSVFDFPQPRFEHQQLVLCCLRFFQQGYLKITFREIKVMRCTLNVSNVFG